MNSILMRVTTLFLGLIIIPVLGWEARAQCDKFNWPEDRKQAEEKVALYGDALRHGDYRAAVKPFQWMLTHAPGWHVKLYIDGTNIYDKLAKKEKEPLKKAELVDSLLLLYDMRLKQCGDVVNVLNRKAFCAYKYTVNQKDKLTDLLALFDKTFEISNNKINNGNLVAYMTTMKANRIYLKNLSDEEVLDRYNKVATIVEQRLKKARDTGDKTKLEKFTKYKSVIDGLLLDMVKVDCDFVKNNLEPKFRQNPNDVTLAKKIFGFMLQGKCTDDPLWLEAGEVIHKSEKDFGLAKNIALKYMDRGNSNKAQTLFEEALGLADTPDEKSDILLYLGSLQIKKGNKKGAYRYFYQVSSVVPSDKRGFDKIGDLYYGSFQECSKKESIAEDRLIYIAAYNMYQRAGNKKKMGQAKNQFPSKEEIFLLNWKSGDTMKIDCWFNETVTLSTRN